MLSCKQLAQQHASDYIDENQSVSQRLQVRLHLLMCGHCRRFVKKLRMTKSVITQHGNVVESSESIDEESVKSIACDLIEAHQSEDDS